MPTATPVAGINVQASTSTSSVGKKRARPDEFDLVINLFTSFGYFGNVEEDLTVCEMFSVR